MTIRIRIDFNLFCIETEETKRINPNGIFWCVYGNAYTE